MIFRASLCVFALVTTPSFADTVWLKNGDRLSGKITLLDGGKVLVRTEYAGVVPIDWKLVDTMESDQELLIKQGGDIREKPRSLKAAEGGMVTLIEGGTLKTVELNSIHRIMKATSKVDGVVWKGKVDIAGDYKRDQKDTDKYTIGYNVTVRDGDWRHTVKGELNREAGEKVTTNNWSAEYDLDRFLTQQWYWQGRLFYAQDKINDPARFSAVGTGPGYQFWDNELGAFSLGYLLARGDYRFKNGGSDNNYSSIMVANYNRYLIGKRVEFFVNEQIERPFSGEVKYATTSEVGFRYRVTDWGVINIKTERNVVNFAGNGDVVQARYTVGFGVTW
ncbi:DUF481 domain-containing protein [Pseudomonas sp. ERGC3:05]|nr:DUF481 domain-containing protein [Pseudomonas sp. ERGC3:01]QZC92685.1 DUF481 domain-containing protein [Pseudomonas sp. ERGC3:05]